MKLLLPGIPTTRGTDSAPGLVSAAHPAPEPNVSRFLRVEVKHHHEVPSRSRAGLPPISPTLVEADADDVVELEFEGGIKQWISVEQLRLDMAAAGQRSGDGIVRVPTQPLGTRPARSRGVTKWVLKGLKVLGLSPVDTAADWAEGKVIAKFETELKPTPGLHRLESPSVEIGKISRAEDFTDPAATTGTSLIFIHGTASSIAGSFSGLAEEPKVWDALRKKYGRQIFGFQHPTLTVSPVANALALAQVLPAGATLHLVSHSRGGLVGELLCLPGLSPAQLAAFQKKAEAQDQKAQAGELAARQATRAAETEALQALAAELKVKQFKIERFVRVACPARGTILASGRLDLYLSLFTSAVGLAAGKVPGLEPIHEFAKAVVLEVARRRTRPEGLPGIEAQMPESPLIHLLNNTGLATPADLAVIAGDIEGGPLFGGNGFGKWLGVLATDLFYWEDHDLVVNTSAMEGGMSRGQGVWRFFDQGTGVSHFHYFTNPRTRDCLVAWLERDSDAAVTGFERHSRRLPTPVKVSRSTRSTAGLPVLFILPGIMGTLLGDSPKSLLWLDQQRLAVGGLRQLASGATGIVPLGLVQENYGAIAEHLSREYEVVLFGYDWRLSVIDAGALLAAEVGKQVQAGRTVRLLAHSMGGLVARAMIAANPNLWNQVCVGGGRLVQLGTPNRGSYAIPRVLWGVDSAVRMLAMIDPSPLDELCAIFAAWPGVIEMLPQEDATPDSPRGRFFDAGWWRDKRPGAAPAKSLLMAAAKVREQLDGAELKNTIYVAGIAAETPDGLTFAPDGSPIWSAGTSGDGTVAHALGNLAGHDVYYMEALHGDLADHAPAFDALSELLAKGATKKLPSTLTASTRASARDGRLRDDAPLLFPSQEDLLAAALRSRPRRRAAPQQELPPLQVTVYHGDLRLARHPVVVGHYRGDKIVNAEKILDEQLDGRLTHHWKLGLYTGAEAEAELVLGTDCQPPGAIVVGLGEVGEITSEKVRRGVRSAALRYALDLIEQATLSGGDAPPPAAGLSVLLLGTNGGRALRFIDSVGALVAGVREANQSLQKLALKQPIFFETLQIIELYETLAIRALHAAHRVARHVADGERGCDTELQPVKVTSYLQSLGAGRFIPSLDDTDTGWWPRIIITGELDPAGRPTGQYRFAIVSDRAGIEERLTATQTHHIEAFIRDGITSSDYNRTAAAGLFELLVPENLKERLDVDAGNLVLLLDRDTARIPWEMLARRAGAEAGQLDPLALRIGMVRQFRSTLVTTTRPLSRARRALVIGDTMSGYAELAGAQEEAQEVAALFARFGLETGEALLQGQATEVLGAILTQDYRILHIAAHGEYNGGEPGASGVVLGDHRYFGPNEVNVMTTRPELAFINCCHLGLIAPAATFDGETDQHLSRLSEANELAASLAVALIAKGVKAVIVAGWAVDDAAARTFATVFYGEMLGGACFGDAVLRARQETQRRHSSVNTWCAYQCYGSPDYRLENDGEETSKKTTKSDEPEFPFVSRLEFFHEVRGVEVDSRRSGKQLRDSKPMERFERLIAQIPPHWRDGEMLYEIGMAYAGLGHQDKAIEYLAKSLHDEPGLAPVRAIQQLSNFEDRTADAAASLAGNLSPSIRQLWQQAAHRLEGLQQMAVTRERNSLLGAMAKRQAGHLDGTAHRQQLTLAAKAYRQTDELARAVHEIDPYAALNWLACEYLLLDAKAAKDRGKLLAQLRAVQETIVRLNQQHSDFWTRIYRPDALLLQHLLARDLHHPAKKKQAAPRDFVLRAYRNVLDGGALANEIDSARRQFTFLIKCLEKEACELPERAAVVPVLAEIEAFLASRQ